MNELTARTPSGQSQITLTYDAAGNLTQDGDSEGDHKYTWDYRNRLLKVAEKQSGNWNTIAECKYDASGRRIRKAVTNKGGLNGTTRYVWNAAWQCLEEEDGSGDLVARYTYAPGYIDAVAVQERDLNADDDFADADEMVYYHSNALFSVYALSNASENVVERYRYDAYGGATVLDADGSADSDGLSDAESPYLFTGRRLDSESDIVQYRLRYYAPALGRFVSRDAIQTRNLYAHGDSNPIRYVDAMGLVPTGLGEVVRILGGCVVEIGVDKLFREISPQRADICKTLKFKCSVDDKNPPKTFRVEGVYPEVSQIDFAEFLKCAARETLSVEIIEDIFKVKSPIPLEADVKWHRDARASWVCLHAKKKVGIDVTLDVTLKAKKGGTSHSRTERKELDQFLCGKDVYDACCCTFKRDKP